jgi:broad specificity phosphatase PhoE
VRELVCSPLNQPTRLLCLYLRYWADTTARRLVDPRPLSLRLWRRLDRAVFGGDAHSGYRPPFIMSSMTSNAPDNLPISTQPGSITIARHGQPDADRSTRLDWRGYEDWWDHIYQPASLVAGQQPPKDLVAVAGDANTIFASTLIRAIETAKAAAPGRDIIIDDCLIEAELPPPVWPGRFQAKTWGVFARCSWWMGNARGRECRADAELRAAAAVDLLTDAAKKGPVLACAHGWFNRMMRPPLKRSGWVCVYDGGDTYWSFRRYEYRSD